MRIKEQSRSSMLILNRSVVVAGAVLIAVISIGLGYFIGFKTGHSGTPEVEQIVEKPLKIPEEKRVLELPQPKQPEGQPAQNQPPEMHQQDESQGSRVQEAPQRTVQTNDRSKEEDTVRGFNKQIGVPQRDASAQERDMAKQSQPDRRPNEAAPKPQSSDTAKTVPERLPPPQEEKKALKQTAKPQSQQRLYTIQFGAFPSRQGAEELRAQLKSKGINAYIVEKGKEDIYFRVRAGAYQGKKEAERNAISIEKQTGIKGFITVK